MKRTVFILCILFTLAGCKDDDATAPNLYLIPDGYKGWVKVVFDKDHGQPTKREGKYNVIEIGADGNSKIKSTVTHEGWATNKYYYVAEGGRRKELKPGELIHGAVDGRESKINPGEENFFVGTQKEFAQATNYKGNVR